MILICHLFFFACQVQSSHHRVVELMGEAAQRGRVTMILRRRVNDPNGSGIQHLQCQHLQSQPPPPPLPPQHHHQNSHSHLQREFVYPYDVIVSRNENESFGFVIISASNQYYGSTIGTEKTLHFFKIRIHRSAI